jgi:hypothetical protein
MQARRMLASRAGWARAGDRSLSAAPGRSAEPLSSGGPAPWGTIGWAGGLCWLIVSTVTLLAITTSGGLVSGAYGVTTETRAFQHLLVFLAAALAYRSAIALGWPASSRARARVIALNTLLALAVLAFSQLALTLMAGLLEPRPRALPATLEPWPVALQMFLPPYALGLCAIALVRVAHRRQREALRAAELASAHRAARMAMLSAQLQPHFLFNSLHAISVLIDDSPREAATMLARLGEFLRHALASTQWPWVDLATELAGLEAYLAVQQTRFSDRLRIAIDASPDSLGIFVPALLLQPLAENAIEHGRRGIEPALQVGVASFLSGERLRITVSNSSPRLTHNLLPAQYRHGLSNVEQRLAAAYGADARLTIGPDAQGGTSAVLDLPLRRTAPLPPAERAPA